MDKNTLSGLLLIGAIFLGFTWYSSTQQKKAAENKRQTDSIYRAEHPVQPAADAAFTADTLSEEQKAANAEHLSARADSILSGQIGELLVAARTGEEQFVTLENDKVKVSLSTLGGRVAAAELKEYKRYDGTPLMLFEPASSKFDMRLFLRNTYGEAPVNTSQYYFEAVQLDPSKVSMRLNVAPGAYVEFLYTLSDNYMLSFETSFVGMDGMLAQQNDLALEWESVGSQNEKGFDNENNFCDLTYMYPGEKGMEKLGMAKGSKQETVGTQIKWVAFKQQFFSTIIMAGESFSDGYLRYDTFEPGSGLIKKYTAKLSLPFVSPAQTYGIDYYLGPNKYSVLDDYGHNFQKLVPLGWGIFGWVNRWIVIPVFDLLSGHIASFGLIILLLTIFIKIIISPLTYKSYLSTAKMRLLKPEMDELAKKYPDQKEAAKKQQATMELYKRAGVNPMGGCLPMLIQFPILIAMFRFFPAAIELRGEAFLWADDLSSYDSIWNFPAGFSIPFYGDHVSLFALLMGVSLYFYSLMNSAQMTSAGPQMAGMKFVSLYMMPVMMILWFNNYSSGLSYYYLLSNVISMGQTWAFRYAVNDQKLHAQMKANAKKPVKKSKWSEKYEQLLKDQQRQQKELAAARAKKKK